MITTFMSAKDVRVGCDATMGWYQSEGGGFVFNAGSTDWVLGLADPAVERITRNVLDAARK